MSVLRRPWLLVTAVLMSFGAAGSVSAQDFFSGFFGGGSSRRYREPQPASTPFFGDFGGSQPERPRVVIRGRSGQAFCVRTCDGRFFPVNATDGQDNATVCNNFCPASETKIFYGSAIENASAAGKNYSDLPNAFKFRNEVVAGCTCNGKDQAGLAPIKIEDDATLRKGDIVVTASGQQVVGSTGGLKPRGQEQRRASRRLPSNVSSARAQMPSDWW